MCAPQAYCIATRGRLSLADFRAFRLLLSRRKPISASPTSCPVCHSANCRRSKRRSVLDYLFSLADILPWRCTSCELRFHAHPLPLRTFFYAHCGICGNLELQRISAEHVPGVMTRFWRVLRIPALRCEPCRHKFFSVKPVMREEQRAEAAPVK